MFENKAAGDGDSLATAASQQRSYESFLQRFDFLGIHQSLHNGSISVKSLPFWGLLTLASLLLMFVIGYGQARLTAIYFFGQFNNVDRLQLETLASNWRGKPMWSLDLRQMQADLLGLSWIKRIEIKPGNLGEVQVFFEESLPSFRWRADRIVDSQGNHFVIGAKSRSKYQHKPKLIATEDQLTLVPRLDKYLLQLPFTWYTELTQVTLQPWGGVELLFGNLKVILEQNHLERQMRYLQLYFSRYEALPLRSKRLDLRYNNGWAVAE